MKREGKKKKNNNSEKGRICRNHRVCSSGGKILNLATVREEWWGRENAAD